MGGGLLNRTDYTRPARWLERLYSLPRPMATIEDWERCRHLDLPMMDADGLELEAHRLRHRLAYDDRPDPWLLERRNRVHAERSRRRLTPRVRR